MPIDAARLCEFLISKLEIRNSSTTPFTRRYTSRNAARRPVHLSQGIESACAGADNAYVGDFDPVYVDEQNARALAKLSELITWVRAELIARGDPADKAAVREAEDIAQRLGDLVTFQEIRHLLERHGGGPWPAQDITAITGRDADSVRRVLDELVRQGFMTPSESGQHRS